jgi:hypothetical protein
MNRRDLLLFLGLEIFAIIWAGTMFSLLENKLVAGALAGGYFVVSGLFMLYRASRWPRRWASLTWYSLMIHVFVISLPMLLSRFLQRDLDFNEVRILGLSGPQFHQLSSVIFTMLMVATVLDWVREWWAARSQPTA